MTITAAADGSALGNPGPAGWAWYIDDERWRAGGWPRATNNQGELMAVLDLLHATEGLGEPLRILCDSQYVINSVTQWMPGWKRRGWRKADGKPVLNRELLERLDAALQGRDVRFEWVKGHAGHPLNEAADARARAVAEAYQAGREADAGPGIAGAPLPDAPLPAAAPTAAVSPTLF
ncbi:MAG: ribonuclease HI [Candidatus Leucobacter sulfamidivorax]|nr:ribonuclease HI [Candidatus Leucobacter sulfamidivorax]